MSLVIITEVDYQSLPGPVEREVVRVGVTCYRYLGLARRGFLFF